MTDAIRTPDEILADLPDFPFTPAFRTWEVAGCFSGRDPAVPTQDADDDPDVNVIPVTVMI